ncbi:MAG: diguanylate cyclase [Deltaproteobacteria bacterium]|nr:diguanylate cyclase [Deltaproteobacteria bacterium]
MERGRILIVDEDWFARDLYSEYLQIDNNVVDTTADPIEAFELLQRNEYDIIITDMFTKRLSGLDFIEEIRKNFQSVSIIVISGVNAVEPAVKALRLGAFDYLLKPVNPETLKLSVKKCLEVRHLLKENLELKSYVDLYSASQRIVSTIDPDKIYSISVETLMEIIKADCGVFVQKRESGNDYIIKANKNIDINNVQHIIRYIQDILEKSETAPIIEKISLYNREEIEEIYRKISFIMVIPLKQGEKNFGNILLFRFFNRITFSAREIKDAEFLMKNIVSSFVNIQQFSEIRNLAYIDELTGLYNIRYFEEVLKREINKGTSNNVFSILFMDLDHFKEVNDTYGHLVGSKLLVEVGRVIKNCVRENDITVRYGGDEFCVLLTQTGLEEAVRIAERIRKTIESHKFMSRESFNIRLTVCIGVAVYPHHSTSLLGIIEKADNAMYAGKNSTRNVVNVAVGSNGKINSISDIELRFNEK